MGRRLAPATLQGWRHGGAHHGLLQRRPPCRPVGDFSALVVSPPMWTASTSSRFMVDPALWCTGAPPSSLCGDPSRQGCLGEEARDAYKRRKPGIEQRVGWLVGLANSFVS